MTVVIGSAVGAPEACIQMTIAATHLEVIPLTKEGQCHLFVRSAKVVIQRMIAGRQDAIGYIHPLQVLQRVVELLLITLGLLKEAKEALELLLFKARPSQYTAAGALVHAGVWVVCRSMNAGAQRLDAVAARAIEITVDGKGHAWKLTNFLLVFS